ncbi:MAG: penicillin-binding transpeptidase domain-containing protein [Planctomycetota bacterium]
MRRAIRNAMPSMFQRRLTVLSAVMLAVLVLLGLASARLTLGASHRDRLAKADDALVRERLIPTKRGRVLDRHGRVLAEDVPGWAVAVDYAVINGDWPYRRALAEARATDRGRWAELDRFEREAWVAELQGKYDMQVDQLWQTLAEVGGVERETIDANLGEVVERVSGIATSHAARRRTRLAELSEESVSWTDAIEPVMEQTWSHEVVEGLGEDARTTIQAFLAEAERDEVRRRDGEGGGPASPLAVWREVELVRPSVRVRPFETLTVRMDRSGWPSAVRSEEPTDVRVEGVGMHWVGMMRSVWAEDVNERPLRKVTSQGRRVIDYGGYRTGDRMGAFGVERAAEDRLRGTRGRERVRLDTGDRVTEPPPIMGRDVQLTLDIQLQAHLRAMLEGGAVVGGGTGERVGGLMSVQPWHRPWESDAERDAEVGRPLNGCVVVMDVERGDLLAAVSVPGMPMRLIREAPSLVYDNHIDAPYRNRAIRQSYEPGSTIKPIVAAAALADGRLGAHEEIDLSRGYLWEGKPTKYRDWIFKRKLIPFPPADVEFAIGRSSNVFFGILAQRLGRDRLIDWFERFGMGRASGLGLGDERGGVLQLPDGGWEYLAIGEAGVEWTPVQAAAAYAALARDGAYLPPRLMGHVPTAEPTELGIRASAMDRVLAGMTMSANDDLGTTHHLSLLNREPIFNVEGIAVMAKSGTAEAAPLREVLRYDEDGYPVEWGRPVRSGDHAWVIALARPTDASRPTHVVAVVVEYGGSGGQVAGPIANQAIALLKQEGYL